MGKTHRGKGLWRLPNRGRGICPLCQRTGVKLLYTALDANGKPITVCKRCRTKKNR